MCQHFLSLADHDRAFIDHVLDVALRLRDERQRGVANAPLLAGQTLLLIFEKPSLRTRVSFEQAAVELGGTAMTMGAGEVGLGRREPAADVARVLSGMVHGLAARVFEHQTLLDLREASTIPVINALSDHSHPCQALADAMTLIDAFGRDLAGRRIAYIGDANNVAYSLGQLCGQLGMTLVVACPPRYTFSEADRTHLTDILPGDQLVITHDAKQAVQGADAIYTDTWVSMGQEEEKAQRLAAFHGFQVNEALLEHAPRHAVVLHCLPAYRGHEISEGVLEGERSRVFPQAHNRLHAQKGLLAVLMGGA